MFFLLLDLHWDSPKLPWGMQRICGPFVLKTIIMPFKRLFVLWHSLIRSLYFIQVYIFIPLIHSAPFLGFSHILLYTNFFLVYITTRNIFLIPVARNLIIIFNFSSQRPHLNYIFLSNVYSFSTYFKPLKLWKKYREDRNRHIPQKINEFASLALAGRYPCFNGVDYNESWRSEVR